MVLPQKCLGFNSCCLCRPLVKRSHKIPLANGGCVHHFLKLYYQFQRGDLMEMRFIWAHREGTAHSEEGRAMGSASDPLTVWGSHLFVSQMTKRYRGVRKCCRKCYTSQLLGSPFFWEVLLLPKGSTVSQTAPPAGDWMSKCMDFQ